MALLQKRKFTFTWQIQNFSMCPQEFSFPLKSSVYAVAMLENSEWELWLYPRGYQKENNVACFLHCRSVGSNAKVIQTGFALTIFSDDLKKHVTAKDENQTFEKDKTWGFNSLISRDVILNDKETYLPNNTLTIKCSLWRSDDVNVEEDSSAGELKTKTTSFVSNTRDCSQSDECTAVTRIVVQCKKISWTIRNLSSTEFNEKLTIRVPSALKCMPSLFITFCKSSADETANIEIRRDKTDLSKLTFFKCKVSVLHTPQGVDFVAEDEHLFKSNVESIWKVPSFIKLNKLAEYKYLKRTCDTLHLFFEFSCSGLGSVLYMEKVPLLHYGIFVNPPQLIEEFRDMYKDGDLSDLTIRAGSREFKVHKIILKARSPVFKAMFDNDMKEKETGVIDIIDVDPDTIDKLLDFMYTNAIEDVLADDALKLYSIADKYEVLSLKFQCTCILASSLSVSNVCQVLTLADAHNDEFLRECAAQFVAANSIEIFKSQEWENFMKTNSVVAAEVMFKMLTTEME